MRGTLQKRAPARAALRGELAPSRLLLIAAGLFRRSRVLMLSVPSSHANGARHDYPARQAALCGHVERSTHMLTVSPGPARACAPCLRSGRGRRVLLPLASQQFHSGRCRATAFSAFQRLAQAERVVPPRIAAAPPPAKRLAPRPRSPPDRRSFDGRAEPRKATGSIRYCQSQSTMATLTARLSCLARPPWRLRAPPPGGARGRTP